MFTKAFFLKSFELKKCTKFGKCDFFFFFKIFKMEHSNFALKQCLLAKISLVLNSLKVDKFLKPECLMFNFRSNTFYSI